MKNSLLRVLYSAIPAKRWLFEPLRRSQLLPKSIYRHLFVNGSMRIRVDTGQHFYMQNNGHYIETLLYWGGIEKGWERVSASVWMALCSQSNYILDVGANTGIYSLLAYAVKPRADICAFEPVPGVLLQLQLNNALNGDPIRLFPIALGPADGEATLYDNLDNHYEASLVADPHGKQRPQNEYKVAVRSIDSLLTDGTLSGIDLMKVDVEKFEAQVLAGFKALERYKPAILIEILDDSIGRDIEQMIKGLGYHYFNIDEERGLQPVAYLGKSHSYNFLLAQDRHLPALKP
ncbi:MAG: FkbM family methyltransferase [Sphingomonadales bacterium]|nr:FkbM family methyltransferase [Sphingomonadales bacterium]